MWTFDGTLVICYHVAPNRKETLGIGMRHLVSRKLAQPFSRPSYLNFDLAHLIP